MLKINSNYGCILLIFFLCFITDGWANDEYEIVTHSGVNETVLSTNSLRAIFSMHLKSWQNGEMIKVYVLPDDSPLHKKFAKEKLNVFPYQLRNAWDRLVFSGTGQAPNVVHSSNEMLSAVASTPGSIGYLEINYINDDLNVLKIK